MFIVKPVCHLAMSTRHSGINVFKCLSYYGAVNNHCMFISDFYQGFVGVLMNMCY